MKGLIDAIAAMCEYLEPEETKLRELTDFALEKLEHITDAQYAELDLVPDFDEE